MERTRGRATWVFACGGCLLLTIAAIVVIAPVFRSSGEGARESGCLSNMKQLAIATLNYAADWDDRLPPAPRVTVQHSLRAGSTDQLRGSDLAHWFPPDDWHRQIHFDYIQAFVCPAIGSIYSYDFNTRLYGTRLPQVRDTATTIMQYEAGFTTGSPRGPHRNGYSVNFCDGHARWLKRYGTPGQDVSLDGR